MTKKYSKVQALRNLNLSLEPAKEYLTIGSDKYVLCEPTETASCQWRDALVRATRLDSNGKPIGMDGISNSDSLLLSMCLFREDTQGKLQPVNKQTILSWPSKIVRPLVDACKEMGGFDEEDDEDIDSLEEKYKDLGEKISKIKARSNGKHTNEEDKEEPLAKN